MESSVCASPSDDTIKLVNVPVSPVAVVNALAPSATPSHDAVRVPVVESYTLETDDVLTLVVVSYLLAVDVLRLADAAISAPV